MKQFVADGSIEAWQLVGSFFVKTMTPLILVVDDDALAQGVMRRFLERQGYQVDMCGDGEQAIAMLDTVRPDLILLDANMPVLNGFDTCVRIREHPDTATLPIVMVTGRNDAESVDRAFAAGAEEYITKPIQWAVLRQRIRKIIERKAMEAALHLAYEQLESRVRERTAELQRSNEQLLRHQSLLEESELKFRSLVESSPDVIMILNDAGDILFINRVAPPLTAGEIPGASVFGLLPPASVTRYRQALKTIFHTGMPDTFRIEGLSSSWWQVRIVPLPGQSADHGRLAMVIATDTTENYHLQAKAMQNARLATVGTLAAGVAHEVNNPNNAVLLQAQWLADAWAGFQECLEEVRADDEERFADRLIGGYPFAEALDKFPGFIAGVLKNTRRVGLIAGNLKRMSRPNSGRLDEWVRVDQALQAAHSILANQINKYTDTFVCDCNRSAPRFPDLPEIRGNAQQLEQVFINLILNGLQSLQDRKGGVTVAMSHDPLAGEVVVRVIDTGIGIPEAHLDRIMDPFFTTRLEQGGTGLGLAISHSIVKNHGGRLEVESAVGHGTTVAVHLPISRGMSGGCA